MKINVVELSYSITRDIRKFSHDNTVISARGKLSVKDGDNNLAHVNFTYGGSIKNANLRLTSDIKLYSGDAEKNREVSLYIKENIKKEVNRCLHEDIYLLQNL